LNCDPLIFTSWKARIIGVRHQLPAEIFCFLKLKMLYFPSIPYIFPLRYSDPGSSLN
jgi:hypothetical protein